MRIATRDCWRAGGISLVETIVSVGVLAIVIPLALAAMLKASTSGASARAETRAPAIAEYCLVEIRAARSGLSNFFPEIEPGEDFGGDASFMGLGFGRDGAVLGKLSRADFENGVPEVEGKLPYYLARVSGKLETGDDEVKLVTVTVDVDSPASRNEDQRSRVSFHTKLP